MPTFRIKHRVLRISVAAKRTSHYKKYTETAKSVNRATSSRIARARPARAASFGRALR
jgi:hypothetical protein